MANCLLSVALLFASPVEAAQPLATRAVDAEPAPVFVASTASFLASMAPQPPETKGIHEWQRFTPPAGTADISPLTSTSPTVAPDEPESSFAETARPVEPEPTPRERALNRLAELGAQQWVVRGFDCIGWRESGWVAKRSDRQNDDGTWDHSFFQFNDVHRPALNARGLDPYVPEDAAEFAWVLYRQSGFGPWSATRGMCGV